MVEKKETNNHIILHFILPSPLWFTPLAWLFAAAFFRPFLPFIAVSQVGKREGRGSGKFGDNWLQKFVYFRSPNDDDDGAAVWSFVMCCLISCFRSVAEWWWWWRWLCDQVVFYSMLWLIWGAAAHMQAALLSTPLQYILPPTRTVSETLSRHFNESALPDLPVFKEKTGLLNQQICFPSFCNGILNIT